MTAPGTPIGRGFFVTFEGPEGAGKTSQLDRAARHLASLGHDVLITREPGGTPLGERIRDVLLARTGSETATGPESATDATTDALLFNAARRQLVTTVIRPALDAGRLVLCDRFTDSTLAYQGYGAGVSLARLADLAAAATDGLTPGLTLLLDVPPDAGLRRKAPGEVTRFEAEFDLAFHQRVRDGFLALAAREPDRFVVVDADRPVDVVAATIQAILDDQVPPGTASSEPDPDALRILP